MKRRDEEGDIVLDEHEAGRPFKQAIREADPMGFLVAGMTELLMYQLGHTKCDELKAKYGLLRTLEEAALEEEA